MTSRVTSPQQHSRYLAALRRTAAAGSVATRSAAVGALIVLPLAACSNNDEAVFAAAEGDVATTTAEGTAGAAAESTTITTLDGTTTSIPAAGSASVAGATFPAGAELLVDFTYEASGSGRILNPYIAVWIEDTDGNLIKTVSVWFEQSSKGAKYLKDLQQWSAVSGQSVDDSVSGATRVAGSYTVAWDGTDDGGNLVAQGEYVLNIEAAREHGPYEMISSSISIGDAGFSIELTPNGELTAASATLAV